MLLGARDCLGLEGSRSLAARGVLARVNLACWLIGGVFEECCCGDACPSRVFCVLRLLKRWGLKERCWSRGVPEIPVVHGVRSEMGAFSGRRSEALI